jgi:hypothetical protein
MQTQTKTPTRIASAAFASAPTSSTLVPSRAASVAVVGTGSIETGSIPIRENRLAEAQQLLDRFDITAMKPADIIALGQSAEQALHKTLGGFLSRLDKGNAAAVFALFERLEKGVKDADLPGVLKDVQRTKPSLWALFLGALRLKGPKTVAREAYAALQGTISGRTKSLSDEMTKMESELERALGTLAAELEKLNVLKEDYLQHFGEFAFVAAVSQACLAKSVEQVKAEELRLQGSTDVIALENLRGLQNRLQLLKSRALALEAKYTGMPGDAAVIQQIESAGVTTFQETLITASSQFSDIKMTLLAIHGAFSVKAVQSLGDSRAAISKQLTQVRGQLMKVVVTSAANAAGDNRLAQVQQIEAAITQVREAQATIAKARETNEVKFEEARKRLAAVRDDLAKDVTIQS